MACSALKSAAEQVAEQTTLPLSDLVVQLGHSARPQWMQTAVASVFRWVEHFIVVCAAA
jgi:hypothetical protein